MKFSPVKLLSLQEIKTMVVHEYQRQINSANVRQITQSIQANGFLPSHPLVWFRHEGKRMLVFGHHRREAAINAKSGAYAVEMTGVSLDETINLIRSENWGTWKVRETVAMEIRLGNPEYLKLMEYVKAGISINAASSMLSGESAASSNYMKRVKDGSFKVKCTRHADMIVMLLKKFPENKVIRNANYIKALSRCLYAPKFDIQVLIKRIVVNPGLLENRSTIDDATDVLEALYNHGSKSPIPLKFLADQAMRERTLGRK